MNFTEHERKFLDAFFDISNPGVVSQDDEKRLLDTLYELLDNRPQKPRQQQPLQSLEEFNKKRREFYDKIDASHNKPRTNGIACPKCGAELVDSNPSSTLMSNPPKKDIHCLSCDYSGYRIA